MPRHSSDLDRRAVLAGLGAMAGAPIVEAAAGEAAVIDLRLLLTSDLHMFVADWDYFRARTDPTVGFDRVATLIGKARGEASNTLLFDNGDFIQGNPLADQIADQPDFTKPHPIVSIMGDLGYDAAGLGNHEFNFGLPFLERSLAGASLPFVCSNVTRVGGGEFLPPLVILRRSFLARDGSTHSLRIGVIGFVPPQITAWDKAHLEGRVETSDIVETARRLVPLLRPQCDLIFALSHSGISTAPYQSGAENASFHLAAVPGIDVIFTGHSHRVFPGPDYANLEGIDAVAGRLQGVPAVMPGFWGSHLGLIDLRLVNGGDGWHISAAKPEARAIYRRESGQVVELSRPSLAVDTAIEQRHKATLAWVERPAGALATGMNSFFVWTGQDPASAIIASAQVDYARPLLAGTAFAGHPVLSAAAPYRTGYTPDMFIDLPAGPLSYRQVADLYMYSSNTVTAVLVTGRQIVEWLECAAGVFSTVQSGVLDRSQALLDKRVPSYNFDTIAGLSYEVDVTCPPRYERGLLLEANRRIRNAVFDGAPLKPEQEFVVLTNNYRVDGNGFPPLAGARIVLRAPDTNREAVARYIASRSPVSIPDGSPWSFAKTGRGSRVHFDTAAAAASLAKAANVSIEDGAPSGYCRVSFALK